MSDDKFELPQLTPLELNQIITLNEAARDSSLSVETIEQEYGDLIIQLSPKRRGIRRGHALMLNRSKKQSA
jgi:hypothetical protein